ncbi:MAG: hypothetical protein ACYCRD_08840 [Leptospirillum sp.]
MTPWRAAVGGRVGALHVCGGPILINGVGTGTHMGLTLTAHPRRLARAPEGALMVTGVFLSAAMEFPVP